MRGMNVGVGSRKWNSKCGMWGKQLTGTAKWANMLGLYEVDKRNVYRVLTKVTERNMKPGMQYMMKVIFTVAPSIL